MRLHPRTLPTKRAANEIGAVILAYVSNFNPTFDDLMHDLGGLLVSEKFLRATGSLADKVQQVAAAHELTRAEFWGIVGGEIQSWTKNALREERHPGEPDYPADEA